MPRLLSVNVGLPRELIEDEAAAEIEQAIAFAEAGTWEPDEELTRFAYSEVKAS